MPNLGGSLSVALDPFISHPESGYLMWNWLSPFLAWALGVKSFASFFLVHLLFSIMFTATYVYIICDRLSERAARVSLIFFAVLPFSATSYFWVGGDSLTLLLMMLSFAFSRYLPAVFAIGFALGMQHFEQSIVASLLLIFALFLNRNNSFKTSVGIMYPIILALGVSVGKIALNYIFEWNDVVVEGGRDKWVLNNASQLFESFFFHAHYIVFSILGVGWLIALKYAEYGRNSVSFFIPFSSLIILSLFVADQTRVLSIVMLLLVSYYWLFNESFLNSITNKYTTLIFLLWIVVPWFWVWVGDPRGSAMPYDIVYILNKTFGWFGSHQINELWPFRPLWPI